MKCLVPVKRVVDYNVKVHVKADGSDVDIEHVKMSMNPFDEIAMEEAVRLRESGIVHEIVAVSIGPKASQEVLRMALARGADHAILVEEATDLEPLNIAKILKHLVQQEKPDFVIMGKQAIDNDCNQTGQMLAGLLGWAQGTYASKVVFNEQNEVEVTREIDSGLETVALKLPCVITTDLRLNEPRYITLPDIMHAKAKQLKNISASDLGIELKSHLKLLNVAPALTKRLGVKVQDVKALIDKLKNEAKVI